MDASIKTRRNVLAGALGALGVLAARALGGPPDTRATDGDPMLVGHKYSSSSVTQLKNLTTSAQVLHVESLTGSGLVSVSGSGYGVRATSSSNIGVQGQSTSGVGVKGLSTSNFGVWGYSENSAGVDGGSTNGNGVVGGSSTKTGVFGNSGGIAPPAPANTGVYGYAEQDATSNGVMGESPAGAGVYGKTTNGYAGYFDGRLFTTRFLELPEITKPATAPTDRARLFVRDNGAGKTQLCVLFHTGAVQVLATEP